MPKKAILVTFTVTTRVVVDISPATEAEIAANYPVSSDDEFNSIVTAATENVDFSDISDNVSDISLDEAMPYDGETES